MEVLVIDNYDSFTYNLVNLLKVNHADVLVLKSDAPNILEKVEFFSKILISPGPGIPHEAGFLMEILELYKEKKDFFGVCLGHQALGLAFQCDLKNLQEPKHGVQTPIHIIENFGVFQQLPKQILVGRYHSWVIDSNNFPQEMVITAKDSEGEIMGFRHQTLKIQGIQFHPESIMTEFGQEMIQNWLKI